MSASTGTTSSASVHTTPAFWERLWRAAGIRGTVEMRVDIDANDFVGRLRVDFVPARDAIMAAAFKHGFHKEY